MRKFAVALLVGAGCLCATTVDSTTLMNQDELVIVTNVKAEFVGVQQIDNNAPSGSVLFGDNNFGVTATKGNVEVVGSVSLVDYPEFGVELNKVYISKGLGESFNLSVGYKDLPYGFWFTNCVNYPLARSGDFNTDYYAYVLKTKAPQIDLTFKRGIVTTDVAGYMHNGSFNSAVAKSEVNIGDVVALNASVKAQNLDTLSASVGGTANLGKFQLSGVYSRGITEKQTASYAEFAVFPTDINVTSIRGDILINDDHVGMSSYSLATLFFITENVYVGSEYTMKANIVNSELKTPTHWITGLIGVEF
jgi:hypothetical protein